jgi:serine/threonine-protein kinase
VGTPVQEGSLLAGKYRVERTIGSGGMGVVVEAVDTRLDRRVAIKFLLPEYAEHGEAASRFMREARAAVKIKSDHSARVIDVGTLESGSPYMVMEYLEGLDLAQIIERDAMLSVEDAALYVIQASEAVAEAHAHGIVHRDLKPANLFLAQQPDGSVRIKVLDFGISKVVDSEMDQSLTRTSSMMGSPLYMSPEQMRSTRNVDLRTDIWALGVIFYEMVTGSLPFLASSVPELSAKVLLEEHEPLSRRRPDLPLALERVVARTLCKNAADRYPSIAEFAMDLMPFAPQRARHNVERITKVLSAAGLSTSKFSATQRPPAASVSGEASAETQPGYDPESLSPVKATSRVVVEEGTLPAATQANFGHTSGPHRSSRLGLVALLIGGGVLAAGGIAFMVAGARSDAPSNAASPPAAEVVQSLKTPAEPKKEAAAEVESTPEPSAVPSSESPAPEVSAQLDATDPKADALEKEPTGKKVARPRVTKRRAPRAIQSKKPAQDPFGEFGGRK